MTTPISLNIKLLEHCLRLCKASNLLFDTNYVFKNVSKHDRWNIIKRKGQDSDRVESASYSGVSIQRNARKAVNARNVRNGMNAAHVRNASSPLQ